MKKSILFCFCCYLGSMMHGSAQTLPSRDIAVDYRSLKGQTNRNWEECIGAGRANEALRADWQQQLTYLQATVPFKYIRFHGLLHDDMGVYKEDPSGKPIYNWQYIDKVYDFLLSVHIRPVVELSFMPSALAADPSKNTTFWWKAISSPPKDYNKWSDLITQLTRHFKERYGEDEVKQWYFEVWNEPNLNSFWTGDRKEYFKFYAATANAVKTVSAAYRVGGPATAGIAWVREFIQYCNDNKIPYDFIATHSYGSGTFLDQFGTKHQGLKPSNSIPEDIDKVKHWMDSLNCHLPLLITEWNSSSGPKDSRHDTYQNAAFVLHVLRHTEAAEAMSYWTFTDIFEEPGPQVTPFHGGFGLINLQGIKKPTFQAYTFLKKLGMYEINNNDNESYVCRDSRGNVQLLAWDFESKPDRAYAEKFFDNGDHPEARGRLTFNIKNMPNGKYRLCISRVGYRFNDPLNLYREMGSPYNINLEQERSLKQTASGDPVSEKDITINSGSYNFSTEIRGKDIFFIELKRIKN